MKWLATLELKFGWFAIPGLVRYVAMFNGLIFILYKLNPGYLQVLDLVPERVMQGEVWRLFTYIFIPRWGWLFPDWFGVVLFIMYLWWIGDGLEQAIGPFKLTLFYVIGMIGTTIAAFFFGANFSNGMLNNSLFFAFARFYPDAWIRLMYILPVKVKWLAWVDAAFLLLGFVSNGNGYRMAVLVGLGNYLLFFGRDLFNEARQHHDVTQRRQRFQREIAAAEGHTLHQCTVCHKTELSDPDLDFRVAADGNEYCLRTCRPRKRSSRAQPRDPVDSPATRRWRLPRDPSAALGMTAISPPAPALLWRWRAPPERMPSQS